MEIKEENILNAYKEGDENVKKLLEGLFPQIKFKGSSIMQRIKTFEDACNEIGEDSYLYNCYESARLGDDPDLEAFLMLRIIVAALNEGWRPTFAVDEERWYPCFTLWTKEELEKSGPFEDEGSYIKLDNYRTQCECLSFSGSRGDDVDTSTAVNHHLYLNSEELADYCGKQFIELWADYLLPQITY